MFAGVVTFDAHEEFGWRVSIDKIIKFKDHDQEVLPKFPSSRLPGNGESTICGDFPRVSP